MRNSKVEPKKQYNAMPRHGAFISFGLVRIGVRCPPGGLEQQASNANGNVFFNGAAAPNGVQRPPLVENASVETLARRRQFVERFRTIFKQQKIKKRVAEYYSSGASQKSVGGQYSVGQIFFKRQPSGRL